MPFIKKNILVLLLLILIGIVLWSASVGAYAISLEQVGKCLWIGVGGSGSVDETTYAVFWHIRFPRIVLAIIVGSTLAVSGVGFQGLFRNPLADAGLIGVGAGATLAAMCAIILGGSLLVNFQSLLGQYLLNISAFIGAIATILLVYRISKTNGKTSVAIMLLAGIAINAIVGAASGLLTIGAKDDQLRTVTFWSLGSLGSSNWTNILALLPFAVVTVVVMLRVGKPLNALSLGEQDAASMGIPIEQVKNVVMIVCAIGVGACVAMTGMIGFVGLVVPHIFRLLLGPEHKQLIKVSILGGAILLLLSDLISRTLFAPIEIPIGVITSLVGGPFFLYLLLKDKRKNVI